MSIVKKTLIIICFILTGLLSVKAQEPEYKMELGGMLGGSFYMGDANYSKPFRDLNFGGGAVARQIFNPYMAIKYNFAIAGISGSTSGIKNKFPGGENVDFKRLLFDIGAQFEYNFLPYGTGKGYKRTKRITPYILAGIGFTFAPAPAKALATVHFPIGLGVKYKIMERLNLGLEWTMRFSMSDKLDVTSTNGLQLSDPYNIKSRGIKNKDSYSFLMLTLTYDLLPKLRICNNL